MIYLSLLHGKDFLNIEKAIPIPIEKLYDFPNHPFKVIGDSQMIELQDSIKKYTATVTLTYGDKIYLKL